MRKDLIQLSNSLNSFTHPEVVNLSQRLDRLLDEYHELQTIAVRSYRSPLLMRIS